MSIAGQFKSKIKGVITPTLVRRGWRGPRGTAPQGLPSDGSFGYDDEPQIRRAVQLVSLNTMSTFERLATLWQQVRYVDRYSIEGSLVECGVWKGGSSGMMALAHMAGRPQATRDMHLFDSFEGLPEPKSEKDGVEAVEYSGHRAGGALNSIQQCVGTLEENRKLMENQIHYPSALLHYHVGWFESTLPKVAPAISKIALLRLDGDWYESTRVCLEHLYSKVVDGGVVVVDDYGHWEGCRKAVDEFLQALPEPVLLNHIDYTGRSWVRLKAPRCN